MDQSVIYDYEGSPLWIAPTFVYEVELHYMSPRRANILSRRIYTSDRLLKVKEFEIVKRFKKFYIERLIILTGAPIAFIRENNLPVYEPKIKKHKQSKKKKEL